jgi:hypothetical protein
MFTLRVYRKVQKWGSWSSEKNKKDDPTKKSVEIIDLKIDKLLSGNNVALMPLIEYLSAHYQVPEEQKIVTIEGEVRHGWMLLLKTKMNVLQI